MLNINVTKMPGFREDASKILRIGAVQGIVVFPKSRDGVSFFQSFVKIGFVHSHNCRSIIVQFCSFSTFLTERSFSKIARSVKLQEHPE